MAITDTLFTMSARSVSLQFHFSGIDLQLVKFSGIIFAMDHDWSDLILKNIVIDVSQNPLCLVTS